MVLLAGFSRGAYIARALAGMLHKVWLIGSTQYLGFDSPSPGTGWFALKGQRQADPLRIQALQVWKEIGHRERV